MSEIPLETAPDQISLSSDIPYRRAAKLVQPLPDGRYPFVCGDRPLSQGGRLNLIGGGVDKGETLLDAMRREAHEETKTKLARQHLQAIGRIVGRVSSSKDGKWFTADWVLFAYHGEMVVPPNAEIYTYSSDELAAHFAEYDPSKPLVSRLAHSAIQFAEAIKKGDSFSDSAHNVYTQRFV